MKNKSPVFPEVDPVLFSEIRAELLSHQENNRFSNLFEKVKKAAELFAKEDPDHIWVYFFNPDGSPDLGQVLRIDFNTGNILVRSLLLRQTSKHTYKQVTIVNPDDIQKIVLDAICKKDEQCPE